MKDVNQFEGMKVLVLGLRKADMQQRICSIAQEQM